MKIQRLKILVLKGDVKYFVYSHSHSFSVRKRGENGRWATKPITMLFEILVVSISHKLEFNENI